MNFLASLGTGQSQQQFVISANTWSSCLAYCEGIGLSINSIQAINQVGIYYNVPGTNSYQINVLDSQGNLINNMVWETDFNTLTTWLDSQEYQSIKTVQFFNRTYVVV